MQTNKMPAINLCCIVARAQIVARTSILARVDHHETSRQHREYLKRLLKHMDMKPTPLAKAAGLAASTLTRVLDENSTKTFSARTISKLQKCSGIPMHFGGDPSALPGLRGLAEDAVRFDAESADPTVSAAITALIGGRQAAVPWTIRTRALECIGYLPDDIVIVDLGRQPKPGDVVCADVYVRGRRDPETVMRIYDPPILAAASFDEQVLRRPLMIDDARVTIKGVVLPHRLRPSAPLA
jgi:hypothetical protein